MQACMAGRRGVEVKMKGEDTKMQNFARSFFESLLSLSVLYVKFIGMKVTSKTMYTLHFLCALAIKSKDWPMKSIHLREIAKEYNIPFKFLEQIAILMKSVGLVRGARGKLGGYQL